MPPMRPASLTLLASLLFAGAAFAQTAAPASTAAPSTAPGAAPKAAPAGTGVSGATNPVVSSLAVTVGRAVGGGQLVSCPSKLQVSRQAVCIYSKQAPAQARTQIRTSLAARAAGDWKLSGQSGSLLVKNAAGQIGAYVLIAPLGAQESLLVVDAVNVTAPAAKTTAAPAGVVKGQPYLLGKDLVGVVNVVSLGAGKFRLNVPGETALTVTVGQRAAQRAGGNVDLPLAPVSDGKNLIFPLSGLRALGCTVTDAPKGVTITCGPDSVGVLPIVF